MSDIPEDLHYTEEHEYLRPGDEDGIMIVGITDYAQGELGDIVYVELPEVGATFDRMDVFGSIEAVKAVSELFAPVSGEIVEINEALESDPNLINQAPYEEGWMIKIRMSDDGEVSQLLNASNYAQHIGE